MMHRTLLDKTISVWRKIPFAIPFLATVTGICFDRFLAPNLTVLWLGVAACLFFSLIACSTQGRRITFVSLFFTTIFIFATWHHIQWNLFPQDEVSIFLLSSSSSSSPVCLEAIACEQPKIVESDQADPLSTVPAGDRTKFLVSVKRIRNGPTWSSASGFANLTIDGHLLSVNSGDRLRVLATLQLVQPATNPGEFDFRKHARTERRLCQLRSPYPDCITVLQKAEAQGVYQVLQKIRGRCQKTFSVYLDASTSNLASALLLGLRDQLSRERIDSFFLTGTMHLLAISGLHVGILAYGFFFVARRGIISYRPVLIAVMIFIFSYALLTEVRPPVMRAAVLVQVVCVSWLTRRRPNVFNSLLFAAIVVLLWNPMELFKVGAQLSFLAVATLCWLSQRLATTLPEDPLDRLIWRTRPWQQHAIMNLVRWIKNMLIASGCVWAITLPLTMAHFHIVTPYAILLNVVLIIPITLALFTGVGLIFCAEFFTPFAIPLSFICNLNLHVLQAVVDVARDLPGSHFWVAGPSFARIAIFYIGCAAFAISPWKPNVRWTVLLWLGWFIFPSNMPKAADAEDVNRAVDCTFVDVGHGTCVLLELPSDRTVLYDCGQLGVARSGVESISAVLWSKRISHLDAAILSHADADHYNALPGLLERFSVGVVYVGPHMFQSDSSALKVLRQSIVERGIPIRTIASGNRLKNSRNTDASLQLRLLHPTVDGFYQDDNERSLVLSVEFGENRMLLPGDVEGDGLEHLLVQPATDYDLVMAPHHGSLRSSPAAFIDWTTPEWTVISSKSRPASQRSVETYASLGQEVRFTGDDGAVFVKLRRQGEMKVSTFLPPKHDAQPAGTSN